MPVVTNVGALVSISTISLEIKLWLNKCSTGTGTYLFSGFDFFLNIHYVRDTETEKTADKKPVT